MKFIIDTYKEIWQYFWEQQLVYLPKEHSFYMDNVVNKIDIELMVNTISLAVSDNIIVNVNGFCGLDKSMVSCCQVPKFQKGILKVEHSLEHGLAYGISEKDFLVHVNIQTGWVCIGNPEKKGDAVEFINNCVVVIDDDKNFVSLWLKPEELPKI
ncbi:MAG: hypothetical protein FWC94_04915 [Bacteroidales bacterium]|nr:hypothetical protein [Bacteroidales bacterium]